MVPLRWVGAADDNQKLHSPQSYGLHDTQSVHLGSVLSFSLDAAANQSGKQLDTA